MNSVVEGIVVKVQEFKDHDAILHVYTKEYGRFSLFARGIKKTTSKNAAGCNLYSCSLFTFSEKENTSMHLLKTAEKQKIFHHIYEDLLSQSIAQIIVEAIDKVECDEWAYLYDVLYACLAFLHEYKNPYIALGFMLAKLNIANGITPLIEGCVYCGNQDQIVSISIDDGGFVCANCFHEQKHQAKSLSQLQFFRLFHKAEKEDLSLLSDWQVATYEDVESILQLFLQHSGVNLKSVSFLDKIRQLNNA